MPLDIEHDALQVSKIHSRLKGSRRDHDGLHAVFKILRAGCERNHYAALACRLGVAERISTLIHVLDILDLIPNTNFPIFLSSCNFIIHEKSPSLIEIQKKKLIKTKIVWVSNINRIKKNPSIFIANEFFDAISIKQFRKKNNLWFEKFVNLKNPKKAFFFEKKN